MTQTERVEQWIDGAGGISARTAARTLGIMYLSGRIRDLRAAGKKISITRETYVDRNGRKCRYNVYSWSKK